MSFPRVDPTTLEVATKSRSGSLLDLLSILAISGLGGHAFGSFKQRGGEHMWLRDALPRDIVALRQASNENGITSRHPIARVMIYGYSSQVAGSCSVQNVDDLAGQLRQELLALTSNHSIVEGLQPRPIVILSHSLGGLVLKEVKFRRDALQVLARSRSVTLSLTITRPSSPCLLPKTIASSDCAALLAVLSFSASRISG